MSILRVDSSWSITCNVIWVVEGRDISVMITDHKTIAKVNVAFRICLQIVIVRSIDWSSILGKAEHRSIFCILSVDVFLLLKNIFFGVCKCWIAVLQRFRNSAVSYAWGWEMIVVSIITVFMTQASVQSIKTIRFFNGSDRGTSSGNTQPGFILSSPIKSHYSARFGTK